MMMIILSLSSTTIIIHAFSFTIDYRSIQRRRYTHTNNIIQPSRYHHTIILTSSSLSNKNNEQDEYYYDDDDDDDDDEEEMMLPPPSIDEIYNLNNINEDTATNDDDDVLLQTRDELQSFTVTQLKQQLRLRGKKVTGNKSELIERLLDNTAGRSSEGEGGGNVGRDGYYTKYEKSFASLNNRVTTTEDDDDDDETIRKKTYNNNKQPLNEESKRVIDEAKSRGADIVDVTDYIDDEEIGKSFKSLEDSMDNKSSSSDTTTSSSSSKSSDEGSKSTTTNNNPEVWGNDAKIIDDYEGRSIVVDGLSRTIIEYTGANNTIVTAYVVGSRESLQNFLKGGQKVQQADDDDAAEEDEDATTSRKSKKKKKKSYTSMEEEVYAIQTKRELESKRTTLQQSLEEDEIGQDADPSDIKSSNELYNTIERDYGDWGIYTPTGAQLSKNEVQGVLLLSDVYGAYTDNTQELADKIAFECQPVVVIVPDLFRGHPWTESTTSSTATTNGDEYEEWRRKHAPEWRVNVDIRAAAAVLRERYAVSSIAVWGTCYGGGRALEAASGWYPGSGGDPLSYYEDTSSSQQEQSEQQQRSSLPPHVDPVACVAWYPTRYNATQLFGKSNEGYRTFHNGQDRNVAIMAIFAGNDVLEGATPDDATLLQRCLEDDTRVVDYMVKIFPDVEHGFAHNDLGKNRAIALTAASSSESDAFDYEMEDSRFMGEDFGSMDQPIDMGGDAEVACLLSTAWMETYTRVFLPTVGTPVKYDDDERWSSTQLEIEGMKTKEQRQLSEVRAELDEQISNHEDVTIDFRRMSQTSSALMEGPGIEKYEQIEEERERIRQRILEKYNISEDDDEETFDRKFQQARDEGALDELLLDAYLDDSGDAYW